MIQRRQKRRAQSLVEFALIAPIFFMIVFGIIEGGRLLWVYHSLSNATKEGARYTTVRGAGSTQDDAPATEALIEQHMLDVTAGLNSDGLEVNLVLLDGDMNDRSRFRVESTYNHEFIIAAIFGMGSVELDASSTDQFWREPDD